MWMDWNAVSKNSVYPGLHMVVLAQDKHEDRLAHQPHDRIWKWHVCEQVSQTIVWDSGIPTAFEQEPVLPRGSAGTWDMGKQRGSYEWFCATTCM